MSASDGARPVLDVNRVVKRFGGVEALRDCTLQVAAGTITGLIGPNGAGKTSLFNVVSGLLAPDGGEIRLDGRRIDGLPPHRVARLGLGRTFQIPRPLGRMTVLENLMVYGRDQLGESLPRVFTARAAVARQEGELRERARETGAYLTDRLRDLGGRHPAVGDVRGTGLFLGVELVEDRDTRAPAGRVAAYVANRMRDAGVLVSTDGPHHNVLKIKPPLCFGREDADLLVAALDRALGEAANEGC